MSQINSVKEHYSFLNIRSESFKLLLTKKKEAVKILSNFDFEKACSIDKIPCRMLKNRPVVLVNLYRETSENLL